MPKLIEGRFYQRRDGNVVGPVEKLIAGVTLGYNWFADIWTYNEQGKFSFSPHELDLVKEVPRERMVGQVSKTEPVNKNQSSSSEVWAMGWRYVKPDVPRKGLFAS